MYSLYNQLSRNTQMQFNASDFVSDNKSSTILNWSNYQIIETGGSEFWPMSKRDFRKEVCGPRVLDNKYCYHYLSMNCSECSHDVSANLSIDDEYVISYYGHAIINASFGTIL